MKKNFLILSLLAVLISGCATHKNLAESDQTATVKEEWTREGMTVWGGTRIYQINEFEFGYLRSEPDARFTVDAGKKKLKVWYFANRGNAQGLFWQTDLVDLAADFKANTTYQVTGVYGDKSVRFKLVDYASKEVIVESEDVPIVRRPYPGPTATITPIPIFIPVVKYR